MIKWLSKCVKQAEEFDKLAHPDYHSDYCKFESSLGDCSLLQQLKEKQTLKMEVAKEVKALENYSVSETQHLLGFLTNLTKAKIIDFPYGLYGLYTTTDNLNREVDYVLRNMSVNQVNDLCKELMSLKQRSNNMKAAQRRLNLIETEIKELRDRLGIE